ncbi:MAG: hypothetical protein P8J27_17035 [Mariniblastus sp.]|nr:hypothetical protein [Mariniblastus sp.]
MIRKLIFLSLLFAPLCAEAVGVEIGFAINPTHSTNPFACLAPAAGPATSPYPASAAGLGNDLMPLEFPKKIPAIVKNQPLPSVEPFFKQFDRCELVRVKAQLIEPWIYVYAIEPLVADFEEAMDKLKFCDSCLDEALINIINRSHKSLMTDPAIDLARSELDKADVMITFLIEIAKLEL